MKKLIFLLPAVFLVFMIGNAQEAEQKSKAETMHGGMDKSMNAMHKVTKSVAVLHPTEGNDVTGTVTFTKQDDGVLAEANVSGLTPGKHGFHIHEWGDCTAADGTSAGGHYNPEDDPHAGPMDDERHMGDMGNLDANEQGVATLSYVDPEIKLNGPMSIVGHAIIVHAGEDDLTSQPTGAAGARVACGVIGIAQDGLKK